MSNGNAFAANAAPVPINPPKECPHAPVPHRTAQPRATDRSPGERL